MLRRFLTYLVVFPLAVVLVAVGVVNTQRVDLILDPFRPEAPALALSLPFYAYLFAALVLGILIGKGVEESGWNHVTKVMMVAIVLLFVLSGFFRGFDMKMIESFHLTVPNWLDMIHNSLSGK